MSKPVVVDYDPGWPVAFAALRKPIWQAVSDFALSVEHVGSTSVPGLAAKPIIDLDVIVPNDGVPLGIARLEGLGYKHRGDLGIPGREAFRRPALTVAHHVYLCPTSSPALANHLGVRDYLRSNVDVAFAYGALKKRLAREFPDDIDGYMEGKTPFLLEILRKIGLGEGALSDIEAMNRRLR